MGAKRSRLARFDHRLMRRAGIDRLAGADEVGRGCLAGPVVVAAVILPPGLVIEGANDSKKLSPARREKLFGLIRRDALAWAAWSVSAAEVDARNVLQASLYGLARVVDRLRITPELVLVDGHILPKELNFPGIALVKGDGRSQAVAAASIVAKVTRDRMMRSWDRHWPAYGFDRHVGYPTPVHLAALEEYGPCPLHRQSFAPVARAASQGRLDLD